ncbi:MAG: hypothetical protein PEPC_01821 [Peptostreptococcus russellii]
MIIILFSCQNDLNDNDFVKKGESNVKISEASIEVFSKILSKAVKYDCDLRNYIKKESLKKITMDYDVFYPLIKNEIIHNNLTFRDILMRYVENEDIFKEIEQKLPLLTIFIPQLPSGFNANAWNSKDEIPCITTGRIVNDSIYYYQDGMNVFSTSSDMIPGFPVLVLKNNERIKRSQGLTKSSTAINYEYEFIDEIFNGINPSIKTKTPAFMESNRDAEFLIDAYKEMGANGFRWQRDNIYYGFKSTNNIESRGAIDRSIVECLGFFYLEPEAMNKIADQKGVDPMLKDDDMVSVNTNATPQVSAAFWTDGQFEFKIDVLINNVSGLGSSITKYFFSDPNELFDMIYEPVDKIGEWRIYRRTGVRKSWGTYLGIDLVTWDLENNGFSWKFLISEIDDQQQETIRHSNTSEFAANFSGGFKIGLNFGASQKKTRINEYTLVTFKNSDDLGTLELNFSDPVIVSQNPSNKIYYGFPLRNKYVDLDVFPRKRY